jgi:hypothetical protein
VRRHLPLGLLHLSRQFHSQWGPNALGSHSHCPTTTREQGMRDHKTREGVWRHGGCGDTETGVVVAVAAVGAACRAVLQRTARPEVALEARTLARLRVTHP